MVDLKGLRKVTAKGQTYYYAWRGGPRMNTNPANSAAFAAEFAEHHAARKGGAAGRISGLVAEWRRSPAWAGDPDRDEDALAASTRKAWKRPLDDILSYFGDVKVSLFDEAESRRHIRKWRDQWKAQPRAADMRKQVLSALLSFAVAEGHLKANPCFGVPNIYRNDRSELIWTEDDLARFEMLASRELTWALRLACLTGLRQSDLLKLSWSHVRELSIEMRTGKSRGRKTAVIPLYQELRDLLAEIPKRATTVLTNSDCVPWKTGFGSSWNTAMKTMGEEVLHFHDARGTFATTTYELGVFSIKELAEMLAWSEDKVERLINRYVRKDALLRDRIRRMDEARQRETGS